MDKAQYNFISPDYTEFISSVKASIRSSQQIAIRRVNTELINLYYSIGKQIALKQKEAAWGDDLIGQMERDLKLEFPSVTGFSRVNLFYMKRFYIFFGESEIVPQLVEQMPWGHIRLIIDKKLELEEAYFYIQKTIENSWSRVILDHQIDSKLYQRQGKLAQNFDSAVNDGDVEVLKDSFKESYVLDFLELTDQAKERNIEQALENNMTRFLMELGKGFAFVGRQYKLEVGGQEFFVDLLFYNYILKRFIVIELKAGDFKPEYTGQIGFYITAIDRQVKSESDKDTIGLIICKTKNKTMVEYALSTTTKPTGVAEYKLKDLPENISDYLPNDEEIQQIINQSN
jgi:predicted nuclease of restriction endonuclease-like (RecB) superfamily